MGADAVQSVNALGGKRTVSVSLFTPELGEKFGAVLLGLVADGGVKNRRMFPSFVYELYSCVWMSWD